MNIFDLSGPEFLVFYSIALVVWSALYIILRNFLESGSELRLRDIQQDPYAVAFLRTEAGAVRVALGALVSRGVIEKLESGRYKTNPDRARDVRNPLESKLCTIYEAEHPLDGAATRGALEKARWIYQKMLAEAGALPSREDRVRRQALFIVSIIVFEAIAGVKFAVALERGRHNVLGLVFFMIITPVVFYLIHRKRRTVRGDQFLKSLRRLFTPGSTAARAGGVRRQSSAGAYEPQAGGDAALWMASLHGTSMFPGMSEDVSKRIEQIGAPQFGSGFDGFSSTTTCSTTSGSCGSSGGSSCGSSGCGGCSSS